MKLPGWLRTQKDFTEEQLRKIVDTAIFDALVRVKNMTELDKTVTKLKTEIADLEISKSKVTESHEREKREVEHKVGLLKVQHEQEMKLATQEAVLKVREENLKADKTRFEEQMKFERDHLQKQIESLNTMVGQMMEKLPSAEIYADLSAGGGRGRD